MTLDIDGKLSLWLVIHLSRSEEHLWQLFTITHLFTSQFFHIKQISFRSIAVGSELRRSYSGHLHAASGLRSAEGAVCESGVRDTGACERTDVEPGVEEQVP